MGEVVVPAGGDSGLLLANLMAGAVAPSDGYSGVLRAKLKKAVTETGGKTAWKRDKAHWDNCMKRWTEEGWWKAASPLPPSVNNIRRFTNNLTKRVTLAQTAERNQTTNQTKRWGFTNPLKQARKDREEEQRVAMLALGMAMTDRMQVDMPTEQGKAPQGGGQALLASAPPAPPTGLYPALTQVPPPYSHTNPFIQAPVRQVKGGTLTGAFQMALDEGCTIETSSTSTERAMRDMMKRVKTLERAMTAVPTEEEDPETADRGHQAYEEEAEAQRMREFDQVCIQRLRDEIAGTPVTPARPMHSEDTYVASNLYYDPAGARQPSSRSSNGPSTLEKLSVLRAETEELQQTLDSVLAHSRDTSYHERPVEMPMYTVRGTLQGEVTPLTSGTGVPLPRHAMRLRSMGQHQEEEEQIGLSCPLRPAPTPAQPQRVLFVPFGFADMTSMLHQLPSLHAGADPWIELTESLTAGNQLAVGDLKALLSRCLDPPQCAALLHLAGAGAAQDADPFACYRTALWQALRAKFPTPVNQGAVAAFIWAPAESPPLYLARAERVWRQAFREPHDGSVTTVALWRTMVKAGLPEGPRQCMDAVVGLDAMTQDMWNAQLRHYLSKHIQTEAGSETEIKTLQKALLKKQLKELDETEATKKSKAKQQQQLVVQQAPSPPPTAPTTSVPLEVMMAVMSAGGDQSRPWVPQGQWGGRGGGQGRGETGEREASYFCYNCGKPGHFARDCQSAPQQQQRGRRQQNRGGGGRGYDRQRPQQGVPQAHWDGGHGPQGGAPATQANSQQQWPGGYNTSPY